MTDTSQDAPRGRTTGAAGAGRAARLKAALRSNIAKRRAQAHAARQPGNPPHEQGEGGRPGDLAQDRDG